MGNAFGTRTSFQQGSKASQVRCQPDSGQSRRIDLTLLAQDLEPIVVNDLLENVRVSGAGDLRIAVRRNRRVLLVGQPGSGKSVAMRELASWTAIESDAPTPIPVHLPDLLPRHPDAPVSIEDLVGLAAKRGPNSATRLLERSLASALEEGDAILLLDGLDECKDRAAWMAERLRTLVADLHPLVGVVIATRASAEIPAQRVGLLRVDLSRPGNLDATIDAVLVQCAEVRVRQTDQQTEWLRIRREWLADARDSQAGILEVPQLALLVALIVGSSADLQVPKKRAELLHEAVRESVRRWEHERFGGTLSGTWASDLTPEMLIDGFVSLGRLIEDRVPPAGRADAVTTLWDTLVDSRLWNVPGARARELAAQILSFWDTHVGVFVLDEEDRLTSRSRVFTEVATAMWTTTCSVDALRRWASEAVRYHDSDGVLSLALGLNSSLIDLLLEIGQQMTPATQALAAAAGSISMNAEQTAALIAQLGRHAGEVESGARELPKRESRHKGSRFEDWAAERKRGPVSWPLLEALCILDLDQEQRRQRDDVLAGIALGAAHRWTIAAWMALEDAAASERQLTDKELEVVGVVLSRELPPPGSAVKVNGVTTFFAGGHLDPGLGEVAQRAVRFLTQLPSGAAEQIFKISDHTSHRDADDIRDALTEAGVDTARWAEPSPFDGYLTSLRGRDYESRVLEDVASIGGSSTQLAKHDRWSLSHLSELIRATGYPHVSARDFPPAFDVDDADVRRSWLRALGHAYGIDLNLAAAEAALALGGPRQEYARSPSWSLVTYDPSDDLVRRPLEDLKAEDQLALLAGMHATSHWIAHASVLILLGVTPTWDTTGFFEIDRSTWPPYRASECYLLALVVSPEGPRLAEQAIASTDSARRHALARAISLDPHLDPTGGLTARLAADDDLWVRGKASPGVPPASYWTCRWCGHRNAHDYESCADCELSSRPISKRDEPTS